eukprot:1201564-Amphidinium_carterae.1
MAVASRQKQRCLWKLLALRRQSDATRLVQTSRNGPPIAIALTWELPSCNQRNESECNGSTCANMEHDQTRQHQHCDELSYPTKRTSKTTALVAKRVRSRAVDCVSSA